MTFDFQSARAQMVESQLRSGGVTNAPILAAMRSVPRELFVATDRRELAYVDDIYWYGTKGASRFMAAPATLAKLLRLAEIKATDRVLDIGVASGYSTAVLAAMCNSVVGLEWDAELAAVAKANLAGIDPAKASIAVGDVPPNDDASFDVIVVQGALDRVPGDYLDALAEGGRLVALIRQGIVCVAHVWLKHDGQVTERADFSAFLPLLHGASRTVEFVF